jgi:hypothetical protein
MTITRQYLLTLTVEDFNPADFSPVPFAVAKPKAEAKAEPKASAPKPKKPKKAQPKVGNSSGRKPSGDGDMASQIERAATLWAEANAQGVRGPLTYVAKAMNLSMVTASRRVSRARELGLIAA